MTGDAAYRLQSAFHSQVRRKRLYSGIMVAIFVLLMDSGFKLANDRNAGGFWNGLPNLLDFPFDVYADTAPKIGQLPAHLVSYLPVLIETINIAAVSTLLGALFALVLAFLSSRGLTIWPRATPLIRFLMDAMRALPEIVIALLLIFVLGGGPVPAVIAITIHTTGALGKLFSEANENAQIAPIDGLASVGANWFQRMWFGVLPQVLPNLLSYTLLRFEINIRASSILGFVGAGGIGYELKNAISWGIGKYDEAAAIFLLLFVTIVAVDQLSSHLRNRVASHETSTQFNVISKAETLSRVRRKSLKSLTYPLVVIAYLSYVFSAFDVVGLSERARWENAQILLQDTWSHKVHVTRDNRSGEVSASIEGERKGTYPDNTYPNWVKTNGKTIEIDLGDGHKVTLLGSKDLTYTIPDYGTIIASHNGREIVSNLGTDPPSWVSLSKSRLAITTANGRVSLSRNRTEVFRYFAGWELFFFTFDSPYYDKSLSSLAFGPRIIPEKSNLTGALSDFWHNEIWRHGDVAWAISETVLMAFLGTSGAAILAIFLGFLAARPFTPSQVLRFTIRRIFDFLRGVDGLIWTIALSRPFGPGPLTGTLAILLTEIGNLGKMFADALENADTRQIDGVKSTGARPLQIYWFGVVPQVAPIFLSQFLYSLESKVRSATFIGAISGGGIGLLLTQAIITQKDWEEVTYYIILIILMVTFMDGLSAKLRRIIIHGHKT